jgi:hypothetical protein
MLIWRKSSNNLQYNNFEVIFMKCPKCKKEMQHYDTLRAWGAVKTNDLYVCENTKCLFFGIDIKKDDEI